MGHDLSGQPLHYSKPRFNKPTSGPTKSGLINPFMAERFSKINVLFKKKLNFHQRFASVLCIAQGCFWHRWKGLDLLFLLSTKFSKIDRLNEQWA